MSDAAYYLLCAIIACAVLAGLSLLSRVWTAVKGNFICMTAVAAAVALTVYRGGTAYIWYLYTALAAGIILGYVWMRSIRMIGIPQFVAMLNGIGGLASAAIGGVELMKEGSGAFADITATAAVITGMLTFTGSLTAAGKLSGLMKQGSFHIRRHTAVISVIAALSIFSAAASPFLQNKTAVLISGAVLAAAMGTMAAVKVGGADMPVVISFFNSLSGVAAAVAGMATYNLLLVSIGGIVGASGLLLTRIMCSAMNRKLSDILAGRTRTDAAMDQCEGPCAADIRADDDKIRSFLNEARDIIIVPGYGMALSQAQFLVKELADRLKGNGAEVRFAIHPVAGRMPGHMNVLLCEAGIDYDLLFDIDSINDDFAGCDLVIAVGANDVINPAARESAGTPIYGMPVLNVDAASRVIICNYDLKPGYAGVSNPLYTMRNKVLILTGDAKVSLKSMISCL